jgi:pimeloyl-ACP methyl ester carboxylesterase
MTTDLAGEFFEISGIKIYSEFIGEGEPILMIPGLGAGNWLWKKTYKSLSRNYRLIMPELRGSGRSDKPDEFYSIKLFADDLNHLLEKLSINRVHVIGASMGGFVAQYFASHWPEKVASLTLTCTTLGGQEQIGPTGDAFQSLVKPQGKTRQERLENTYLFSFSRNYVENHRDELDYITNWRLKYPQPEYAYYRQFFAGNAYAGKKYAKKITAPTLICQGREDQLVEIENAYELGKNIDQARIEIFEGKHLFFFEHYNKFNKTVLDFIESYSIK